MHLCISPAPKNKISPAITSGSGAYFFAALLPGMADTASTLSTLSTLSTIRKLQMIDGLVGGKLYGAPEKRLGKAGKPFVMAKVRATAGDNETALFVNVIAFDSAPSAALMALQDGDSVTLAGSLTPKVWTDKQGVIRPSLDMVAHQVLTAYHAHQKRDAMHDYED